MPSIALKRPAETSHARGFAGMPSHRPLLERGAKSVVQRLLGEIEVAKQADQRREYAARFGAVDGVNSLARVLGRRRVPVASSLASSVASYGRQSYTK